MPPIVPIRVLIADDSPTALQSVCDYLHFAGAVSYTHLTLPTILRV